MDEKRQALSRAQLKQEAKRLRALAQHEMSHGEALERVAKRYGFRDWNTACAALPDQMRGFSPGQRVSGRYLGRRYTGLLRGLKTISPRATRVEIEFDAPIDVVRFASFSSLRHRVRGVIRADGQSIEKISTGDAHLVIDGWSI